MNTTQRIPTRIALAITAGVGVLLAGCVIWMVRWTSAGHAPPAAVAAVWGTLTLAGVAGLGYSATIAARRRPAVPEGAARS